MRIEGKRHITSRQVRTYELSREEVLRILCDSLGLTWESTEFKAQGLMKITLTETVDDDFDRDDPVEIG